MKEPRRYPDDWVPVSLEPDPVIDFYKWQIDIAALKRNLELTVEQRVEKLMALQAIVEALRCAGIHVPENVTETQLQILRDQKNEPQSSGPQD